MNMASKTGQTEQDCQHRIVRTGLLGEAVRAGRPEQVSPDCQDRTLMLYCQNVIAELLRTLEPGFQSYAARGGKSANSRFFLSLLAIHVYV
jgi:hypothetical protein